MSRELQVPQYKKYISVMLFFEELLSLRHLGSIHVERCGMNTTKDIKAIHNCFLIQFWVPPKINMSLFLHISILACKIWLEEDLVLV